MTIVANDERFECHIAVELPLRVVGDQSPVSFTIAKYKFDPDLSPGDIIRINDAPFARTFSNGKQVHDVYDPKFSFEAKVLRRRKIIRFDKPESSFILLIELEMADKEQIPDIIKFYQATFPRAYEDCRIPSEVEEG